MEKITLEEARDAVPASWKIGGEGGEWHWARRTFSIPSGETRGQHISHSGHFAETMPHLAVVGGVIASDGFLLLDGPGFPEGDRVIGSGQVVINWETYPTLAEAVDAADRWKTEGPSS